MSSSNLLSRSLSNPTKSLGIGEMAAVLLTESLKVKKNLCIYIIWTGCRSEREYLFGQMRQMEARISRCLHLPINVNHLYCVSFYHVKTMSIRAQSFHVHICTHMYTIVIYIYTSLIYASISMKSCCERICWSECGTCTWLRFHVNESNLCF